MQNDRNSRRAAPVAALLILGSLAAGAVGYSQYGTRAQDQSAPDQSGSETREERLELVTATGVHALSVEVARTTDQQALGLMFRTSLPDTKGMLFPHEEPRESTMWMRNTYIPLDMVFINPDGTVHRIEKRTEPFSERIIPSNGPVAAVLEIAGGGADRIGLKAGDKVRHAMFDAGRK